MSAPKSFVDAYIAAALWSSTDDDGEPLDTNSDLALSGPTKEKMETDCDDFYDANSDLLREAYKGKYPRSREAGGDPISLGGHLFWLARNRHGVGFTDGDYPDAVGKKLQKAAQGFGEFDLFVNDETDEI